VNVLFLGNALLAERLTIALGCDNNIKVDHLEDLPFALNLIKKKDFDFVIVDYLMNGSVDICDKICGLDHIPVVLMLREKEADWKRLYDIQVDGFLAEESSDSEIVARVISLYRRNILIKQQV